jgi:hypothetical protein
MQTVLKVILYSILVIAVDMVLLNIFHAKEYVITGVSVGIVVLAAVFEFSRKKS